MAVDTAYFEDPDMTRVADSVFRWFTFGLPEKRSRSTLHGHVDRSRDGEVGRRRQRSSGKDRDVPPIC